MKAKKKLAKHEWSFVLDRIIPESEVVKALPHKYPMHLNKEDMMIVLKALHNEGTEQSEMLLRDIFGTLKIE